MKEKPILFSAPMVRALLDGRKTQTRRVVKHPEYYGCPTGDCPHWKQAECDAAMNLPNVLEDAPYAVGDVLWVRETWAPGERFWDDTPPSKITPHADVLYRASDDPSDDEYHVRWRPSIFMPRWASRITLEVAAVRAERLQDITPQDAAAEGVTFDQHHDLDRGGLHPCDETRAHWAFVNLWERINGPGSWDANPWVWVYSFWRLS